MLHARKGRTAARAGNDISICRVATSSKASDELRFVGVEVAHHLFAQERQCLLDPRISGNGIGLFTNHSANIQRVGRVLNQGLISWEFPRALPGWQLKFEEQPTRLPILRGESPLTTNRSVWAVNISAARGGNKLLYDHDEQRAIS